MLALRSAVIIREEVIYWDGALYGALIRIQSLGFELMELARISNEVG